MKKFLSQLWPNTAPKQLTRQISLKVESLEGRALMAAPVVSPIPDQSLLTNQSVLQIPIVASDPDGDPLTYSSEVAGTNAYFVATDLGLKASSRKLNWGGQGERWFVGSGSTLYFLKPSGELHTWDGTNRTASGPLTATLDPVYFHYPTLLTKPSNQDLPSLLNHRLGLGNIASPIPNTLGLDEKWLGGSGGARFFIKPDGTLYRATGSPLGSKQTFLVQLPASYYEDTTLLTNAVPKNLTTTVTGQLLQINELKGVNTPFIVRAEASDGTSNSLVSFKVIPNNDAVPQFGTIDNQTIAVGESSVSLNGAATDSDGDTLTYSVHVAANNAYFLSKDLGLKTSKRPTNWGRIGERWLEGNDGFYYILPSGDLHKWDGTLRQASGDRVATLPPVYFHYLDMLTRPSNQDLPYVLDQRLQLAPAATPAPNNLGLNEKWFTSGSGRTGTFFLTPEGGLYRKLGKNITWLADIGSGFYKQPTKLYAASRDQFNATINANGQLQVHAKPNFIGQFVVQVQATDGLHVSRTNIPVNQSEYVSVSAPRLAGAIATGNRTVRLSFSQPMNNSALDPANYQITQPNGVVGGVTLLAATSARFVDGDRSIVELTTLSQSDGTYTIAVANFKDIGGTPFGPPFVFGGLLIDPTRTSFAGRPPSAADLIDSDSDGMTDNDEIRGWGVTVKMLNGSTATRWVTSDPHVADSDADGLSDSQEANLRLDPRDTDSDDDQLNDFQEFNEIFSDAANQDTDGDTLDDSLEFNFFHTSPFQADTEGDQTPDGVEVLLGSRNPRIADIPKPGISVGSVSLDLDVRFTATTSTSSRELESKSVSSTLTQTEGTQFALSDSRSNEFNAKIGYQQNWSVKAGEEGVGVDGSFTSEFGYTGQWTSSFDRTTTKETQNAATRSLQTDAEVQEGETIQREVVGASIKVALSLNTQTSVAFTVKNLQVTAFLPDPARAGRLQPVATLVPDTGVLNEFTLGPLVNERGPFIFTSEQVFPSVVERLMFNPQGLVFKIANYDLTDEAGRNFAFSSQDINDRTAPLVIDYGFGDASEGGPAGTTERVRVATNTGRVAVDTNGDNVVNDQDRPVIFDPQTGQAVGVTMDDAMENVLGLTKYDEDTTPSVTLSPSELLNSYSTKVDSRGVERLWRVRNVSSELNNPLKTWIVYTSNGIDGSTDFSELTINSEEGITLKFMQDLDDDGIDAVQEYALGSSDVKIDTDGDNLPDAVEYYGRAPDPLFPNNTLQWTVDVNGKESYRAFSSPARTDSDNDGVSDFDEFNRFVTMSINGQPTQVRRSLDPRKPDTDGDGVTDFDEINGYQITLVNAPPGGSVITRTSDPLNPDSDGDTLLDGDEVTLGTDPTVDDAEQVLDNDQDGLLNFQEDLGWQVTTISVGPGVGVQGTSTTITVTSDKNNADTDNDGLSDREERELRTNPRSADSDGDGLNDINEVLLTPNGDGTRTVTPRIAPLDADADNDLRTDGVEVNTPIFVQVFGATPYNVFSDPTIADADNDGLVDSGEAASFTDPTKFDTDGDNMGISDSREIALGTNPLRRDQKVRVTLNSVQLLNFTRIDESDPLDKTLEIIGQLLVSYGPNSTNAITFEFNSDMRNNDTVSLNNVYADIVLNEGDTLRLQSSGFYDDDPNQDDFFGLGESTATAMISNGSGTLSSLASAGAPGNPDGNSILGASLVTSYNLSIMF